MRVLKFGVVVLKDCIDGTVNGSFEISQHSWKRMG